MQNFQCRRLKASQERRIQHHKEREPGYKKTKQQDKCASQIFPAAEINAARLIVLARDGLVALAMPNQSEVDKKKPHRESQQRHGVGACQTPVRWHAGGVEIDLRGVNRNSSAPTEQQRHLKTFHCLDE